MGAYNGLLTFFENTLVEIAYEYGYDLDNILILEGNENQLKDLYPKTYNNLLSCNHHADNRSPLEYGRDLVASWIFEDYFLDLLKDVDFSISLSGADKARKILPNTKTSSSSDYLVKYKLTEVKIELMNDYTGFWRKTGTLHLRDSKYKQLINSNSLFIAISIPTNSFTIFDFMDRIPAKYIPKHPCYGGKPAYELRIQKGNMKPFNRDNIVHDLLQKLGGARE